MSPVVFIAMFPLQLVIFPGEVLPLHIFEPRYRELIGDCEAEGIRFVIPTYVNRSVSAYGTEVSLVRVVRRYEDGECDILVRGVRVVEVLDVVETLEDKLYPGARIEPVEYAADASEDTEEQLLHYVGTLFELLGRPVPVAEDAPEGLAFSLAPALELSITKRLTLLGMKRESERRALLIAHVLDRIRDVRDRQLRESVKERGSNGRTNGNPSLSV